MTQQLEFTVAFLATIAAGLIVVSALHSLVDHLKPDVARWFKRRCYRIALVDTRTALGEPVKWYAVQRRVCLFRWVTVEISSCLATARRLAIVEMNRPDDVIIKVVSLEKKARKAK